MRAPDLVLRGRRVLVDGELRPADVHVRDGRIAAVTETGAEPGRARVVDAGNLLVFPGLVDAHVHVNEPGRTEWEGYATATAAALAGGVTTLVDMPLNGLPPLLDEDAWRTRRAAIEASARADVALWAGLVSADTSNLTALAALGVAGVKCFLSPSGVEEFAHVGETELDAALPVLRDHGLPLLAHAESPAVLERALAALPPGANPRAHGTWLATRPASAEAEAIDTLVRLCRRHRAAVHVVHVSSREGCERIAAARAEGLPVTAETCPHYLSFADGEVPDGATEFKCAPPLRDRAQRESLWLALSEGTLDLVASDHSPSPPALKAADSGDFLRAWGGIAGLQLLLPAAWTGAAARGHGPVRLGAWLAEAPARLAGLSGRKGRLAPGCDADFVLWDPDASFVVRPEALHHRHRLTPWAGKELRGVVRETWLRGRLVYHRDHGFTDPPGGTYLPARRGSRGPGPN